MSKLVPNPEYQSAPYELQFSDPNGHAVKLPRCPLRFKQKPPENVWLDDDQLIGWIAVNSIPSHVLSYD